VNENTTAAGADLDGLADYERLSRIAEIDLLNPELVARLDEISRRTMGRLGREASYVSIILDSAQIILSSAGMSGWICHAGGTPVEWSFCGQTVALARTYVVPDALDDDLHKDSPLVTMDGTRSYAGVPLTTADGYVLGAHCVIDSNPHLFTEDELSELQRAAQEISAILAEYAPL
jgi:GAF domain-containing protein